MNPVITPEKLAKNGGLREYSVVYTDRALNHMSESFGDVMRDLSSILRRAYGVEKEGSVALVPGGGSYAMEAVARQFGNMATVGILRNGYFSYRWSQIFEQCLIPSINTVLMAQPVDSDTCPSFAPHPLDQVKAFIAEFRPTLMIAPHVETAAGLILPDWYIAAVAEAVHNVGGLFVLDGIAAGAVWLDMERTGVDVYISAPQKGWSGPPCAGLVMLSKQARFIAKEKASTSFCCNLQKWVEVMETYEQGGHMYHATMPTEAIREVRDAAKEYDAYGLKLLEKHTWELGRRARAALEKRGFKSVAAAGFQAPGVVVSYADVPAIAVKFKAQGLQISPGVPLMIGEPEGLDRFRIGLFGIDKLRNYEEVVSVLERALDDIVVKETVAAEFRGRAVRRSASTMVMPVAVVSMLSKL